MRSAARAAVALVLAANAASPAAATMIRAHGNPIRKVVKMLQLMEKRVHEQGEMQKELHEKYMCYCKTTRTEVAKSIASAKDRLPQLESTLEQTKAMHQQLTEEVKRHQTDKADADEAMKTAIALRTKEEKSAAMEASELKANVNALGKAVKAIQSGGLGSFLQTGEAARLRKLSKTVDSDAYDRDMLSSFLDASKSDDDASYEPQSGEVLGVMKQLHDDMQKELDQGLSAEEAAKASHESLVHAKKKEIDLATKAVEEKLLRIGDLAVEITVLTNDLEDTREGFAEDSKFLGDLNTGCTTAEKGWAGYQKMMGQEKLALAETVKLLNKDEALDLFKKTLPSPEAASFVQTAMSSKVGAMKTLKRMKHKDHRVAFLVMALRGKKEGFGEVKKMIDELAATLHDEQASDDQKKDYCEAEMDRLEDMYKTGQRTVKDIFTDNAEARDSAEDVAAQIVAMQTGIAELDKQVGVATENRKKEKAESLEVLAENNAAKSLLELAKKRMAKFYQPSLLQKDILAQKFQVPSFADVSQPKAPPQMDYSKKQGEAGGVLGMIDLLRSDLMQQNTEVEVNEKHSQASYDSFVVDSADKRAIDSKAITDKEDRKAELEMSLHQLKNDKKEADQSQASLAKEIHILRKDCDWLLEKYKLRKEARTDEIDSINKAKAVLSGATY